VQRRRLQPEQRGRAAVHWLGSAQAGPCSQVIVDCQNSLEPVDPGGGISCRHCLGRRSGTAAARRAIRIGPYSRSIAGVLDLECRRNIRGRCSLNTPGRVDADDTSRRRSRQQRPDLARGVHVELLQHLSTENTSSLGSQFSKNSFRSIVLPPCVDIGRVDEDIRVDERPHRSCHSSRVHSMRPPRWNPRSRDSQRALPRLCPICQPAQIWPCSLTERIWYSHSARGRAAEPRSAYLRLNHTARRSAVRHGPRAAPARTPPPPRQRPGRRSRPGTSPGRWR